MIHHIYTEKPAVDINIDWNNIDNWNPAPIRPFNNEITWKVNFNRKETLHELRYWQWKFKNRKFIY